MKIDNFIYVNKVLTINSVVHFEVVFDVIV